jgi:hypothetical protein
MEYKTENIKQFFADLVSFVKKKFKLVLIVALIGLVLGAIYGARYKPYYKASLSFMLNESKAGGAAGLASLAGQLGLGMGSPTMNEDRILYLLGSRKIIGEALLLPFANGKTTIGDEVAKVFRINEGWAGDTSMKGFEGFSSKSLESCSFQEQNAISSIYSFLLNSNRFHYDAIKKKGNAFVGNQSSGILTIDFECRNEELSKAFLESVFKATEDFYVQAVTKSLEDNYRLISMKSDSIKSLLKAKESETAMEADAAFNVFKNQGRLGELRAKKEVELLNVLYAEIIKNKEIAKFNLDQSKPGIQVIELPYLPLEKKDRTAIVWGLIGSTAFLFLGIGLMIFIFMISNFKRFSDLFPS